MKICEQCGEVMKLENSHRVLAMTRETFRCPGCQWTDKRLIMLASGDLIAKTTFATSQNRLYRDPLVSLDAWDQAKHDALDSR